MALTKQEAKENLIKLIEKYQKVAEQNRISEFNEEATKTAFIQPLLKDVLGWDVTDYNEVSPEERISRGRVDYCLKIDGKPKIFVEAKPLKADINKHIEQAVRYGYNRKGVPFVLLTDFEELKLFDVTVKPDIRNPNKGRKLNLYWKFYEMFFDQIWTLSKESVVNGELDKLLLAKPKDRIPVDKAILDDLKEWRELLAKDIYKNNPNLFQPTTKLSLRGSETTEAISKLTQSEIATPSARKDTTSSAEYLKEITQRILDRIIFMRFCEDRGLIHRRSLKELFEERTDTVGLNTMVFLKEEFKHYNIIFDSDLFSPKEWEDNLQIDFKIMQDIILDTYNPYQFDVIPLEVLGNIYEQYLGYTIRLTPQQVKYELKPDVRKAGGIYYTPEYIVDYIVKNTVGKILQDSTPNPSLSLRGAKRRGNLSSKKIKKLRILDPACGSGSFLIRAYEEMLNYYKEQKKNNRRDSRESRGKSSSLPSPLTGKGMGEGESFSLSLREAERRGNLTPEPIQKELDLKHEDTEPRLTISEKAEILKNHIFGVDIDEQAVEVTKLSLMLKMLEGEFGIIPGRNILPMLDKNIRCGNSLISGSPLELKKYFGDDYYKVKPFNWEEEFKDVFKDGSASPKAKPTARGFDVVIGNPPYGAELYQEAYMKQNYPYSSGMKEINSYLYFTEKSFIILKDEGYFGFIIPDTFMLKPQYESFRRFLIEKTSIYEIVETGVVFEQSKATPNVLLFFRKTNPESKNVFQRKQLDYRKNIDRILEDLKNKHWYQQGYSKYKEWRLSYSLQLGRYIEDKKKNIIQKIINNRNVKPLGKIENIEVDRGLEGGKSKLFKERKKERFKILIPENIYKYYINDIPDYYTTVYKDLFKFDRILIIRIRNTKIPVRIIAALEDNKRVTLKTLQQIYFKSDSRLNLKYLLSIINSKLINYYCNHFLVDDINKDYILQLPIYIIDFSNKTQKKLHDDLVALVDVMLDLNKKIQTAKGSAKDQIQREIEKTDKEIDEIVYKLYGITEEEKKIIEGENI